MNKIGLGIISLSLAVCVSFANMPEIMNKSNDLINLNAARQENPGIDGSGVVLGIIDSEINTRHPSISGKELAHKGQVFTRGSKATHGTHVLGIMAGKKLSNNDPYGVAYNSNYYSATLNTRQGQVYDFFKGKNIKIINNSWGVNVFPGTNTVLGRDIHGNTIYQQWLNREITNKDIEHVIGEAYDQKRLAKDEDTLIVFAAGNYGVPSPAVTAMVPSYDEDIRSWLVVGNLNALNTQKNRDGSITLKNNYNVYFRKNGLTYYGSDTSLITSNLFVGGAANYGILAPGYQISAANALYGVEPNQTLNVEMTGTSMAAPMVSGVAALVAQKYPFLGGSQIADVLLTTANKNLHLPKVVAKKNSGDDKHWYIVYIENDIPKNRNGSLNINQIRNDLLATGMPADRVNMVINNPYFKGNLAASVVRVSKEEYIGQGVLDAQKALRGLAVLDANRLNKKDIQNFDGRTYAFYTIDTKGYDGEFSNNISQKLWDDNLHIRNAVNLPADMRYINQIGLMKKGGGTLILSGANTYAGPTVVTGGSLMLNGSLGGNAYVDYGTLFLNGGVIKQNAYSRNWNGNLNVIRNSYVNGYTYAKDLGKVRLQNNSALHTTGLYVQNNGSLVGNGTINGFVNLENGNIGDRYGRSNININNNLNAYGKSSIVGSNVNVSSTTINNYNSNLSLTSASNLNSNSFENRGILEVNDRSKVVTSRNFINNKNSTVKLNKKDSIIHAKNDFINNGYLSFYGDTFTDLGLIMANRRAYLRSTQGLDVGYGNDLGNFRNAYAGGLGVEIVRAGINIDTNIANNLITLNGSKSKVLDASTQLTADKKRLYFVLNTKENYKDQSVMNTIKRLRGAVRANDLRSNDIKYGRNSNPSKDVYTPNNDYTPTPKPNNNYNPQPNPQPNPEPINNHTPAPKPVEDNILRLTIKGDMNYLKSLSQQQLYDMIKDQLGEEAIAGKKIYITFEPASIYNNFSFGSDLNSFAMLDSLSQSGDSIKTSILLSLEQALNGNENAKVVIEAMVDDTKNNIPKGYEVAEFFSREIKRNIANNLMHSYKKNSSFITANIMNYLDGTKLASNSDSTRVLMSKIEDEIYKNSFNLSVLGAKGDYDSGSDPEIYGVIVSYDRMLDDLLIGGYFSYADGESDKGVELDSDLYEMGLYARYYLQNNEFDFMASYGKGDNDASFMMTAGALGSMVNFKGSFDTDYYTLGATYGYRFNIDSFFSIKPFIGIDYFDVNQDGFIAKTNDNKLNLLQKFDDASYSNLVGKIGFEMLYETNDLSLYVRPAVLRDLNKDADSVISNFVGAKARFTLDPNVDKKTSFLVDLGATYSLSKSLDIGLNLGTYVNSDEEVYSGQLGFKYKF